MPDSAELDRRFHYHAPDDETRGIHDAMRYLEREYAEKLNDVPGGDTREKSLAFTKLEECMFWMHAHIARNLHRENIRA